LDIGELMAVIDYHWETHNGIPKDMYDRMTLAGYTLGVTAEKHRKRARELRGILDDKWPK
jgi:hypothetical protein